MLNKMNLDGSTGGELEKEVIVESIIDTYMNLFFELTRGIREETVLKGNILLNQILPKEARTTKDLAMEVIGIKAFNEVILPRLDVFGKRCIQQGIADDYRLSNITPTHSGGIKVYLNGVTVYGVDIGLLEKLPSYAFAHYSFYGQGLVGSSIEHIIADKTLSLLSRRRFRRTKDFYDLYIILSSGLSYVEEKVSSICISRVGLEEFKLLLNNYPFSEDVLIQCSKIWENFKLKDRNNNEKSKPAFIDVYSTVGLLFGNLKASVKM